MTNSFAKIASVAAIAALTAAAPAAAQTVAPSAESCAAPNSQAATITAAAAEIPNSLQAAGVTTGTAAVQVDIDAEGHVLNASIAKSSGVYGLDQAALRAARESTFQPQVTNCAGVAGSYLFEVDFPG